MGLVRVQYTGLSDQRILSAEDQGLEEGEDLVFVPAKTHEISEELFMQLRGGEPGSWSIVRETDESEQSAEGGEVPEGEEKLTKDDARPETKSEKSKASKPEG